MNTRVVKMIGSIFGSLMSESQKLTLTGRASLNTQNCGKHFAKASNCMVGSLITSIYHFAGAVKQRRLCVSVCSLWQQQMTLC